MSRGFSRGLQHPNTSVRDTASRQRNPIPERAHLKTYRVLQRDLVYVIGIPVDIATEETLSQYEYFGQYGSIKKIVVNSQNLHTSGSQKPTVSAYVTFRNIDDAQECIYSLESYSLNGHQIKASFGTSKYCSSFLCNQKCTNPDCMYLHYLGDPAESFATDEIQQNSQRFMEMTRPTRPPEYDSFPKQDSIPTVFPFRRILKPRVEEKQPEPQNVEPEEIDTVEEKDDPPKKSDFMKRLFEEDGIIAPKLVVNYTVGCTLKEQLHLGYLPMRCFLKNPGKL